MNGRLSPWAPGADQKQVGLLPASPLGASTVSDSRPATDYRVTMVAAAIGVFIVATALLRHDGDIAGLVKFGAGETVAARTAHVEEMLGRDVATVELLGHDGSMFFLQALDPFYLNPEEHAVHLDRPEYRAQRMLFPLLAGFGGLLPPEAILWSMAAVNIAAISFGSLGTARIAQRLGGSLWLGLAFAMNPGIIFEFDISGAGILAFTCAIWGTVEILSDRPCRATAWFLAAVLAREVMLLYVAGVCLHRLVSTRRIPVVMGAVPALGVAGWAGYVRLRLDSHDGVREVQEFGSPFGGMADALEHWMTDPLEFAIIAGLIVVMPLLVVWAVRRPNPLAWGAAGFVLLAVLLTRQVWWNFTDISRAIAPVITAYVVTAFSAPRRKPRDAASPS